jgi:alpha-mannosidase
LVSLRRGARLIEVETRVDNAAEDHRLRLLLPTDIPEASTYLAQQTFDFVERPIPIDPATASWQEIEQVEKPFLGLQSVCGSGRGLAFLAAAGLHEGGVADDARRTMHITLMRSFRQTIVTAGEPDGLEKGVTTFRFALMPFGSELPRAEALSELARLQGGIVTRQTGKRPSGYPPMSGTEDATQSFIECQSGNLVVSAIKTPEEGEGLILRLWNPTAMARSEKVRFWQPVASVEAVALSEEPAGDPFNGKWQGNTLEVVAAPHRIVTLRVLFSQVHERLVSRPQ